MLLQQLMLTLNRNFFTPSAQTVRLLQPEINMLQLSEFKDVSGFVYLEHC